MRFAIVALIAFPAAGCFGSSDPTPVPLPVAPASAITVATTAATFQGSVGTSIVGQVRQCPAGAGVGVLAETADAGVTAIFVRWPAEGSVFDLALPGAEDDVVVSSHVGNAVYCTNAATAASGTVEVRRFEQVGNRYLIEAVLSGVVAGSTTIDAHLYH